MNTNEQNWLRTMGGRDGSAAPPVDVRQTVLDRLAAGEGRRTNRTMMAAFAAVSSAAAVVIALLAVYQLLERAAQFAPLLPGGSLAVAP